MAFPGPAEYRERLREIGADGDDELLDALADAVARALDATPADDAALAAEYRTLARQIDEARGLPHDAQALVQRLERARTIADPRARRDALLRLAKHISDLLADDSESLVIADVDARASDYLAEAASAAGDVRPRA